MSETLLDAADVARHCRCSVPTVRRRSAIPEDPFPSPIQVGPNCVRWLEHEVIEFVASRPRVTKKRASISTDNQNLSAEPSSESKIKGQKEAA